MSRPVGGLRKYRWPLSLGRWRRRWQFGRCDTPLGEVAQGLRFSHRLTWPRTIAPIRPDSGQPGGLVSQPTDPIDWSRPEVLSPPSVSGRAWNRHRRARDDHYADRRHRAYPITA